MRYLNSAMVSVRREAERAEGSVHAVQAVHVAFALVGVSVDLALNKETGLKHRPKPCRPPHHFFLNYQLLLLLLLLFLPIIWTSSSLYS